MGRLQTVDKLYCDILILGFLLLNFMNVGLKNLNILFDPIFLLENSFFKFFIDVIVGLILRYRIASPT